ncbi:MAG: PAS domain S-box protein [Cyanobacteria bacterium J06606_4]
MVNLDSFFELTTDLMCVLDAEGRLLRVNPAFERVLGYEAQAACDRTLASLAHPESSTHFTKKIEQAIAQAAQQPASRHSLTEQITGRWLTKDHREKRLQWTLSVDNTSSEESSPSAASATSSTSLMVYCVGHDITEQAEQRQKSKAETQLYLQTVQNMQVGIYIWQLKDPDDAKSLTLVATNPAASQLTGVPAEPILGQKILKAFPALAETGIPEIYAGVVRNGKAHDLGEVPYRDSRIEESTFRVKAFPLESSYVGISFENVTARKQAETQLQEQAAQLKMLFDQAAVGMARLSPDGHWTQVNQKLCDMLKYTMPVLLEKTFAEVTHPDDLEADSQHYSQLLKGDRSQLNFEKRYLAQDGEVVWADVSVSTSRDYQSGELIEFIATIQDITQRVKNRSELERQKDELISVNLILTQTMALLEQRNQELDQFAYVTSHDLKAPLRAIANLATWIEEDIGSTLAPENLEQFELLKNRVQRMEGLINGLLEYSRIGRVHQSYEQIDVDELLRDIVDTLPRPNTFTVEIGPQMPILSAKKVPLNQVFSNLIGNAIKHHHRANGSVSISVQDKGEFYEFAITDDGPGIVAAYHEKVFTIFQTLKARDELESTGIGLSIVKKVLTAEGGDISIESAVNEGTTFRFSWPKKPNKLLNAT